MTTRNDYLPFLQALSLAKARPIAFISLGLAFAALRTAANCASQDI